VVVTDQQAVEGALEGWAALGRGAWPEARAAFERALARVPNALAYEGLAWAAWWQHDGGTVVDARERACELHRAAGDRAGAARVATLLGSDYADFLGDGAVDRGWLRRARRLLDGLDTIPEHGWHGRALCQIGIDDRELATSGLCGTHEADCGLPIATR
jgi:hypothetical protein